MYNSMSKPKHKQKHIGSLLLMSKVKRNVHVFPKLHCFLPQRRGQLSFLPLPPYAFVFVFRFTEKDKHLGRDFSIGLSLLSPSAIVRISESFFFCWKRIRSQFCGVKQSSTFSTKHNPVAHMKSAANLISGLFSTNVLMSQK